MNKIQSENIPTAMSERPQWVMWSIVDKDGKPDKQPFQVVGGHAKVNDPTTWTTFENVVNCFNRGGHSGIGYMFSADDPFVGIDLDGCRNPQTGVVAQWAKDIILALDSYAEVSPSKTGVKVFVRGKSPFDGGKKKSISVEKVCDKEPAIEVYDRTRYFAVTGWRLKGPHEPQERDITWIKNKFWPDAISTPQQVDWNSEPAVIERARRYISKLPPSIAGCGGHNACFHAACVLAIGFGLPEHEVYGLLCEWNQQCQPPWSERELRHKVSQALKQPGQRNYLRNANPDRWQSIDVPQYEAPKPKPVKVTGLADSAREYIERIKSGGANLIDLGLGDVDAAIGGGVEAGEIIVIGARPSHGKSAAALQIVHQWTGENRPCLIISEEMSRQMLGKRTLQFISDVPQEHWRTNIEQLERAVDCYEETRANAIIAESCGTAEAACEQMESAVANHKVELVVIDYAQLLQSPGRGEYEKTTATCRALVSTAKNLGVTAIFLCQLSREIEKRPKFIPQMGDLRGSGQFEQDADVILFMVWPHKIDQKKPAHEYQVFVAKNRNREISHRMVMARFVPSRQLITVEKPLEKSRQMSNYTNAFAEWENNKEEF